MFDDITEWFSLGIGKSSSTWQCHAALGRAPVFNRERVHSQPPQMVIFVSVTSVRLHALRQQAMVTGCHQSIYGSGGWPVFAKRKKIIINREEIEMMIIIIQYIKKYYIL